MDKSFIMGFLMDLLTILKLFLYMVYSTSTTLVKNLIIPDSLLSKCVKNQIVLITGAAGGIGKHLVRNMLLLDTICICIDVNEEHLKCLENELSQEFAKEKMFFFKIDITSPDQVKYIAKKIKNEVGYVDILINNAGIFNNAKLLLELSEKEILNIFNVNILSHFWLCREFLPEMIARNKGHIVNMSSSLGQYGAFRVIDYAATKFAVVGFTESLRIELKSLNEQNRIKVTLVCPYHVNTSLFKNFKMDSFKWIKVANNDPQQVAHSITRGILLEKELIGYPQVESFLFLALKNLLTTETTDRMMIWFGFNQAINKVQCADP